MRGYHVINKVTGKTIKTFDRADMAYRYSQELNHGDEYAIGGVGYTTVKELNHTWEK